MSEVPAEQLWRDFLATVATDAAAVEVAGPPSLVLWDSETLGAPRPAVLAPDPRALDPALGLGWVAEHEPHTWALVVAGRYAAGPVASYLVARATRGLVHVTTDPAWSAARAAELGVPAEVLPGLVGPGEVGTTDPRLVRGLSVPLRL